MLTGFDHATFQKLHNLFAPVFNAFTLFSQGADGSNLNVNPDKKSGRCPRSVDIIAGLAIVLSWTCIQNPAWVQSVLLGVTDTSLSDCLCFGSHCLNIVLYDN
jgi:hypothetical protein